MYRNFSFIEVRINSCTFCDFLGTKKEITTSITLSSKAECSLEKERKECLRNEEMKLHRSPNSPRRRPLLICYFLSILVSSLGTLFVDWHY